MVLMTWSQRIYVVALLRKIGSMDSTWNLRGNWCYSVAMTSTREVEEFSRENATSRCHSLWRRSPVYSEYKPLQATVRKGCGMRDLFTLS